MSISTRSVSSTASTPSNNLSNYQTNYQSNSSNYSTNYSTNYQSNRPITSPISQPKNDSSSNSIKYYAVRVGPNKFFIDSRYQSLVLIGDGAYGCVASAIDTYTNTKVAIKKIKDAFLDILDTKRILREIKLLKHFYRHENIIKVADIMTYPPDTINFIDIYIVTSLYESDLQKIISSKQKLTERHYQFFMYQLLRALKYVHTANVLHRDLKPSNILVNSNCDLAVCDFGLARGFDDNSDEDMTTYVVTRWYRSPEILCNASTYGRGVDVWSVGCIFAELLTFEPFFRGMNPQHQLEVIINKIGCPKDLSKCMFIQSPIAFKLLMQCGNRQPPDFRRFFINQLSQANEASNSMALAIDLLEKMLQFHPDDRITVEQALQHPYLRDFHLQLSEPSAPEIFDFEFERLISSNNDNTKEIVRYLIYEEMRSFRSSAPVQLPPWLKQNQTNYPTSRRSNRSVDSGMKYEDEDSDMDLDNDAEFVDAHASPSEDKSHFNYNENKSYK